MKRKTRSRHPYTREELIGRVVAVVEPETGGYSVGWVPGGERLTNEEKNAVTAWILDELAYCGWRADPLDVRDSLWQGT